MAFDEVSDISSWLSDEFGFSKIRCGSVAIRLVPPNGGFLPMCFRRNASLAFLPYISGRVGRSSNFALRGVAFRHTPPNGSMPTFVISFTTTAHLVNFTVPAKLCYINLAPEQNLVPTRVFFLGRPKSLKRHPS